jgi:HAD superfamily hydrolase (TIGR01509 family)
VCFDLGGVLVRICRSWDAGCAAAGLELRPGAEALGQHADLHDEHQLGRIDGPEYARALSRRLGGLYSPQEILSVHEAWLLGEYADLAGLIEDLHGRGLVTAALSNTNLEHWRRLLHFPAIRRLHHRLASHELGLRKPDPAIYAALEDRVGRRGPRVAFFDDTGENVEAARARGWLAQRIDPQRETAPQMRAALRAWGVG